MRKGKQGATPFLSASPEVQGRWLLGLCERVGGVDIESLSNWMAEPGIGERGDKAARPEAVRALEGLWYESVRAGEPDYAVYHRAEYLAEVWGCYLAYSRSALQQLARGKTTKAGVSIYEELLGLTRSTGKIVDVGCGFGFTTAALSQLFPEARVFGTNIEGTLQYKVGKALEQALGSFRLVPTPEEVGPVDLVFASEYFEHFQQPLEHLRELVTVFQPRAWLIGNSFTAQSIGHFPTYSVDGRTESGHVTSTLFAARLRAFGYQHIPTTFWNQRPTYWKKPEKEGLRLATSPAILGAAPG